MSTPSRTRDPGLRAWAFEDRAWVVCPRCGGPALAMDDAARGRFRLVCERCSHLAEAASAAWSTGVDGTDGRFGLPLYLTGRARGRHVWAYNLAHLDALADWVGATLRERALDGPARNRTMMSRLPPWMCSAAARPGVVAALGRLRARALREGLS